VGVAAGLQTLVQGLSRGELPELTSLIYEAREVCLDRLRAEAREVGGEHVVGNRLSIRELAPGLLEIVALGTAVRPGAVKPLTPILPAQAVIIERSALDDPMERSERNQVAAAAVRSGEAAQRAGGCLFVALLGAFALFSICAGLLTAVMSGS
jgi:uncharacterized protein YbjQ (UPF0145 family)